MVPSRNSLTEFRTGKDAGIWEKRVAQICSNAITVPEEYSVEHFRQEVLD
jgi:hypothetical protein